MAEGTKPRSLEDELLEKLPENQIYIFPDKDEAGYYDYYGVTFRENPEERLIVEAYIISVIESKVGFKIRITKWGDSNNGHFVHCFERA